MLIIYTLTKIPAVCVYSILILDLHERILNHHCVIYQRIWALSDPYFSRIFIFIEDSVLMREKGGQWKSVF